MILKFTSTPVGHVNFYYSYTPYVGDYWNRVNSSRQIEFSVGQHAGSNSYRNVAFTTTLPLDVWCFVSVRTACVTANTTRANIYSFVRNLETDEIIQDNAQIGTWSYNAGSYIVNQFYHYKRYTAYYNGYSYSRGAKLFAAEAPIDLLAYRRCGVNQNAINTNNFNEGIHKFFNN